MSSFLILTNLIFGFGTFILFASLVSYEFNYDTFNTNYDNIYRVQTKQEDSHPTKVCGPLLPIAIGIMYLDRKLAPGMNSNSSLEV